MSRLNTSEVRGVSLTDKGCDAAEFIADSDNSFAPVATALWCPHIVGTEDKTAHQARDIVESRLIVTPDESDP